MSKIFKYDLKIILLKPYVFAMLIVELIYSYLILSSEIILGISDTAPFSGWSFGAFLGKTTMVSLLVSFFILSNLYSKRQKKVSILADVTGFSIRHSSTCSCFYESRRKEQAFSREVNDSLYLNGLIR